MKKRKKPKFTRPNVRWLKRVKEKWRKPRGIDSKKRKHMKHMGALPKVGYRQPKEVRGLHPSGLIPVRVFNLRDLEGLEKGKHGVIIAGTVGKRKRKEIIEKARELGLRILNMGV